MAATLACNFDITSGTVRPDATAPTAVNASARLGFFATILENVGKTCSVPTPSGTFYSPLSPI